MDACKIQNKFLHCHSLFGGLSDCELDEVRTHFTEKEYKKGVDILKEGEPNNCLYFIVAGDVDVVKRKHAQREDTLEVSNEFDDEVVLSTMGKGDTFGEMELIDIQPCSATVRTTSATKVLAFTHYDLYQISKWDQKTFAMIIMNLAREMSRRLRASNELLSYELYQQRDQS